MWWLRVWCKRSLQSWQYDKQFEDKETALRYAKEIIESGPATFVDGPSQDRPHNLHQKAR